MPSERLCLKNVLMSTPHGIYKKAEGLAKAFPTNLVLANLWLQQFDEYFFNRNVELFRRCIDDLLCIIKKNEQETILTEMNSLNENLKCACDVKSFKEEILFFDMLLKHVGDCLETQWYTKPSSSGLLLNF